MRLLSQKVHKKYCSTFEVMVDFRNSFPVILYLSLLGGSISFVWKTIKQFQDGATSYTEKHEPVSLEDIPTVVTCLSFEDDDRYIFTNEVFPMTYGGDVMVHATILEKVNKTVALLKDQNVQTLHGLNIKLSELVLSRKPKWQCYKITTWGSEKVKIDFQNFRMQLSFSFPSANKTTFANHGNYVKDITGNYFDLI